MYRFDDITYCEGDDLIRIYRYVECINKNNLRIIKISDSPDDLHEGTLITVRFLGIVNYNMQGQPWYQATFPQAGTKVEFTIDGIKRRGVINIKGNILERDDSVSTVENESLHDLLAPLYT